MSTGSINSPEVPQLWIAVHDAEIRDILTKWISPHFPVETAARIPNTVSFGLCIVDKQALTDNRETIARLKEQAGNVDLPVLLVSEDQTYMPDGSSMRCIDDILYLPMPPEAFRRRIQLLLKQRRYSLQLNGHTRSEEDTDRKIELYKQAIDHSNEGIILTDARQDDHPIVFCNQAFEELTGYAEEEILGRNCRFLQGDDRQQPALEKIRSLLENEASGQVTLRNYRKDGSLFWNELSIAPIRDGEGTVTHFVGVQNDISELVEVRNKLQDEKDLMQAAIEGLPGVFYIIDEDQQMVKWNTNLEKQLGYSSEEISQMQPLDFFEEKDHSFVLSKIEEAFKRGEAEMEAPMRHKNGDLMPFYVRGKHFVQDNRGFIAGAFISLADLQKARFERDQQRQLLEAIINQTEAIIYVKDQQGRLKLVNTSYLNLFGMRRSDVIGKTERELHGESIADHVHAHDKQVFATGRSHEFTEKIPVNGSVRYYHTIKYLLKGVPGYENCLCGISTDITEQEQTLKDLQERVKEQTCLFNISSLAEKDLKIHDLLSQAVHYLPGGWQYPDITEAAITYHEKTYTTDGYDKGGDPLVSKTALRNGHELEIRVIYTEARPSRDEGPFLEEERRLIESVTDTLSSQIERILAQSKLEESEERWRKLVQNDPDLIQILTVDGTIKFINPAGARFIGKGPSEELMGQNIFDLIQLDKQEKAKTRIRRTLEGERLPPATYRIRKENGRDRYIESRSVPITLDDGEAGIQQVAQDITDRVLYERELKQSLHEKEVLLREIHHRVKNNLAVVSGLLTLQRHEASNYHLNRILSNCEMRIKSMALIHEKLYQSASLSKIDFKQYVEELVPTIQGTFAKDHIVINTDCSSLELNVNQAVPCGLIISELVSNALEHAFNERSDGQIWVSLQKSDARVTACVRDNGKGMPEQFKRESSKSMGYTIINTLIRQLNASIQMQHEAEKGTSISFTFKKRSVKGSSSGIIE